MTFTLLLLIIVFLLLSALFSGVEIAFVSSSKLRVELKRKSGSKRGAILAKFFHNPTNFLSTMLVGSNLVLVVFTFLMTQLLSPLLDAIITSEPLKLFLITILTTIIILVFGEFVPKAIFRAYSDNILYSLAYVARFFQILLAFPTWIMTKSTDFLLKFILKTPQEKDDPAFTRVDLAHFIEATWAADDEEEINKELFHNALQFRQIKVKDCMIPRTEIQSLDINSSIPEVTAFFQETKLSRIIVTDGDIDNVLGFIHHQQMLKNPKKLSQIVMDIPFIPEVMRVEEVMNRFVKGRVNIACVVDEFGGTAGIITLEDIVEEIFGEIEDEHDREDHVEQQISDNEFLFSGRLEIDYLNEKYETIKLPEGEYHTLSGYIINTVETIPEEGAAIEIEGYRFILESVSDTKIERVRVIKLENKD